MRCLVFVSGEAARKENCEYHGEGVVTKDVDGRIWIA